MKQRCSWWEAAGTLLIVFLAIWHGLEVKAGAAASGNQYLLVVYGILVVAAFAGLAGIHRMLWVKNAGTGGKSEGKKTETGKVRKSWSLEQVYLVAGLLLGLGYLFVLPPLSAPDEISHYIGAYQLSSHMLGKNANYPTGHVLIRPEDFFLQDVDGTDYYTQDENEIWNTFQEPDEEERNAGMVYREGENTENTDNGENSSADVDNATETTDTLWTETPQVLGQDLTQDTYASIWNRLIAGEKTWAEQQFSREDTAVTAFPPVVTTPLAYVPQAIGITLARLFHGSSILLAYMGRLGNLLFFVLMTWLAMKRMPFGKEVLFGVAVLPMTVHLSASMSYDVMILACMFLFTAVCLDLAYHKEKVQIRDIVTLMALMAVAGPCKMVYGVMMGLCLLIPVKKFGGWGKWLLSALCVGGIWAVAMLLVNSQTIATYATATDTVVSWAEEQGYSLTYLIHNPGRLVTLFYNTLLWQGAYLHQTMIGSALGNLDAGLGAPYLIVMVFTGCLILLSLKKPGEVQLMTTGNRIWTVIVCAGCAGLTMLSMLIAWTPMSSSVISGVQGRYFLPFLPVLLLVCKNDRLILTKDINRSILYFMLVLNSYVLFRTFAAVVLRVG